MLQRELTKNLLKRTLNGIYWRRSVHTEYKVKVGKQRINIVQSGEGSNSVLLMPGALGSAWTDFAPQIEKLPKLLPDYTIIAWDPPGYGKSIPPQKEFNLDFYRNDAKYAVELMGALDRSKFSILGWSDGGITGMLIAGLFPENVEKLLIWGAGAYIAEHELNDFEGMRDVNKWSTRMREPLEKLYGKERFAELWGEWLDTATAILEQRDGDYCRKEVENIRAPVFILHGKKDVMVAPEHIPYLRERLSNCKYYEFPDGKHNIHLRYADEFNKLVADFLLNKA